MADTFLSDTEAPSLGLYLVKTPNGIAYEVKRADDDEYLFTGDRGQVRLFLRGYAAALAHPAITHLQDVLDDEHTSTTDTFDAAMDVAGITGGRS